MGKVAIPREVLLTPQMARGIGPGKRPVRVDPRWIRGRYFCFVGGQFTELQGRRARAYGYNSSSIGTDPGPVGYASSDGLPSGFDADPLSAQVDPLTMFVLFKRPVGASGTENVMYNASSMWGVGTHVFCYAATVNSVEIVWNGTESHASYIPNATTDGDFIVGSIVVNNKVARFVGARLPGKNRHVETYTFTGAPDTPGGALWLSDYYHGAAIAFWMDAALPPTDQDYLALNPWKLLMAA